MTTTTDALRTLIERLERCVDVLEEEVTADIDIYDAQAIVEDLKAQPNRIVLELGPTPTHLAPWHGTDAWCAEAQWGPGDARHICYGNTWCAALIELAKTLKLKEGPAAD